MSEGQKQAATRNVKPQNVSLQPVEWKALRFLANRERNGNKSAVVGNLIADRMQAEFGDNWRQRVEDHANIGLASSATI